MTVFPVRRRSIAWALLGTVVCILLVMVSIEGPGILAARSDTTASTGEQASRRSDGRSSHQRQPMLVKIVRPTRRDLKRVTIQPAQVEGYEKTDVFAKATGYLTRFAQVRRDDEVESDLDLGDSVVRGQVLAELSIPEMEQERVQKEARVEQAESELGQALAAVTAAESMLEAVEAKVAESRAEVVRRLAEVTLRESENRRYQQLARDRAVPEAQAEEKLNALRAAQASATAAEQAVLSAEANVKVQQAQLVRAKADRTAAGSRVKVARANLEQTKALLDYARIRAPFDGVVTRRWVDTGAFVQSAAAGRSEPLFTIQRTDRLRIIADIPESDSASVRPGRPAVLTVGAMRGTQFPGTIARMTGALDPSTRTMRVQIELDKPSSSLRPGMFGSVSVSLADTPGAIMVPASALVSAGGKTSVMIVTEGHAERRAITLGFNDGVNVEVTRGLGGDEVVIVEGKSLVSEGQRVQIAN